MANRDIYKGLELNCDEFEKIPIDRRELGMARSIATYEG